MPKRITLKIADPNILTGGKLYHKRARVALPYLVRQAKAGQPIYYSELAEEMGMSNPRNLNFVLGAIGKALIELGYREGRQIPEIQCLVINKRSNLPGEGVEPFAFPNLNSGQKRAIVDLQFASIYAYPDWDWVLTTLGLTPVTGNIEEILKQSANFRGGGESDEHKTFKEFISRNPGILRLNLGISVGITEYPLPSADTVDVLFTDKDLKIGVEVKSEISNADDICRGLFQCVKYKSLIEAEQIVYDERPNCRVILALQGALPSELLIYKNLLGVEVIDNLKAIQRQLPVSNVDAVDFDEAETEDSGAG